MLFLHGALGSKKELIPLTNSNSIALEFPNHGEVQETLDTMTIKTLAQWTATKAQGIKKIFGYSMGGYVALYLAASKLLPIKEIICYGTMLDWNHDVYSAQSKTLDPTNIEANIPKLAQILEGMHGPSWRTLVTKTLELMKDLSEGNGISDEDFKNIEADVTFIVGTKDRMVSADDTARVCELNPRFKMQVLEERPHELFKVPPEEIKAFF